MAVMQSDDQQPEAAFENWLARYRDDELGGSMASRFLTASHLRDAFMAGVRASSRDFLVKAGEQP
jgi:hypothetical protein